MGERLDVPWEMVTCAGCGSHYRCTPSNDYYNNTTTTDGVCERCLLSESKPNGAAPPDPGYISPRLQALLDAGVLSLHPDWPASPTPEESE